MHMKGILIGILALVVLVAVAGAGSYNTIVKSDIAVNEKWGQVQNVLQRRADLVPNLVQTVKGYAAHEKEVLTRIADARSKLAGARTPQEAAAADGELTSALSRLLVVVENYPQLKADQTFIRLMDELSGTENRIAVERMRYNEAVSAYNRTVSVFPRSLLASMTGYRPKPFFEAAAGAREAPKVDFGK